MNNQEYILAGIELADGWHTFEHAVEFLEVVKTYHGFGGPDSDKEIIDALAAQLVRQVDAIDGCEVTSDSYAVTVTEAYKPQTVRTIGIGHRWNRTTNTIKAIVDSGVLK